MPLTKVPSGMIADERPAFSAYQEFGADACQHNAD